MSERSRLVAVALIAAPVGLLAGQVGPLTTFVNGTVADADQVNGNFTALATAVDDNADQISPPNRVAVTDPTSGDDADDGYKVGSIWVNGTSGTGFLLVDDTIGAAVWKEITGGGGSEFGELSPTSLVPILSSATSASPVVVSQSTCHFNQNLCGWKAFNRDASSWPAGFCLEQPEGTNGNDGWLQVDMGAVTEVNGYTIRGRDDALTGSPRAWTFQGSNDGSGWADLDTRTDETGWTAAEVRTYQIPTANYRYFRWLLTENNGYQLNCFQEAELR
jgi:hypothetical protein